jgi:hypothetical protein
MTTNISEFRRFRSSYTILLFNSPDIPYVRPIGAKYVVIFMAGNDSDALIKGVMENKKYHAECRACLGNSKTMKSEPAWFRVGLRDVPKGGSEATHVFSSQKFPDMYAGAEAPATLGVKDMTRNSGTPLALLPYVYGWVVSRLELHKALQGKPCPWDRFLNRIYVGAKRKLHSWWTKKGTR